MLRDDAERTEALVDDLCVDAFAVVSADDFMPPAPKGGHAQAVQSGLPCSEEVRIGRPDAELDSAAFAPGGGDRRVGVGDQLRDDLRQVDAGLREVLAEIAAPDTAVSQP